MTRDDQTSAMIRLMGWASSGCFHFLLFTFSPGKAMIVGSHDDGVFDEAGRRVYMEHGRPGESVDTVIAMRRSIPPLDRPCRACTSNLQ
jgi:hypothetical protein